MTQLRERIRALSGKAPSASAEGLLEVWLLPGEPVEGAIAGSVRLQSAWFIATPVMVFLLRDGMRPSIEVMIPFRIVTGWQAHEDWKSEVKLDVHTTEGIVTLGQVKPRYVVPFGHALDAVSRNLTADGLPTEFLHVEQDLGAAAGLLTELLIDDAARSAVDNEPPAAVIAVDLARAISRALGHAEFVSYGHALLLWFLSFMVESTPGAGTRQDRVLAFTAAVDTVESEYTIVSAMRAASPSRQSDWAELITLFADLVESCSAWLPGTLSSSGAQSFLKEAGTLRAQVRTTPQIAGDQEGTPRPTLDPNGDDLLARLERLQGLRESGALTDDEFAHLKAKLFEH